MSAARLALAALVLVSACAAVPPPEGTPEIEISGVGFGTGSQTRIFATDQVQTTIYLPGTPTKVAVRDAAPGSFARVAQVLAQKGPLARAAVRPQPAICEDYGSDLVQARPPLPEFDKLEVNCPDPAVTALMTELLGIVAAPK